MHKLTRKVIGTNFKNWPYQPWYRPYPSHKLEFEHMCQLNRHIDLHESKSLQSHVIELTLKEPYKSKSDLEIIETLIKCNIENLTQIYRIKKIAPAEKCLGFSQQNAWLVYSSELEIDLPINIFGNPAMINPAIDNEMEEMMKGKKILYIIIITYENMLENPVEYFEELPLYPEWVENSKLLFTWSAKKMTRS